MSTMRNIRGDIRLRDGDIVSHVRNGPGPVAGGPGAPAEVLR